MLRVGQGETMALEVIVRGLRMSLYRVNLKQVVSQNIGETKKYVARVFGGWLPSCLTSSCLLAFSTYLTSKHRNMDSRLKMSGMTEENIQTRILGVLSSVSMSSIP